ncbi:MAG: hypothetical protein K2N03_02105 [Muribaculaceae bacterium]|nr:hypothetical protein [Muribaculaceae bacterium]
MNASSVISINPGKATIGELNPDATAGILRRRILPSYSRASKESSVLKLILGIKKNQLSSYDYSLLSIRVITSIAWSVFIATGFLPVSHIFASFVIMSLLTGFLTRPVMLFSLLPLGCALFVSPGTTSVSITVTISMMICSLILGISGSGNISLDRLCYNYKRRHQIKHRQNKIKNALSYKAYIYNK